MTEVFAANKDEQIPQNILGGEIMFKRMFVCISVLSALLIFIVPYGEEAIPAMSRRNLSDAEERAENFIKDLYKNRVSFKTDTGDGTVYLKRYYCSNICIDVLEDGSLRYLSDVNDADNKDVFLTWLYSFDKVEIISESEFYGFIKRKVKSKGMVCDICIDKKDGRVVTARILFNS